MAELAWLDRGVEPQVAPVTPLLFGDQPAIAYPYAYAAAARRVAASPGAALVLSDTRMAGGGWRPIVAYGRPRLIDDREGTLFTDQLLTQELRKYPPARAFADSLLLRRENWWYLPRLVVVLEVTVVTQVGPRTEGAGTEGAGTEGAGEVLVVRTNQPGTYEEMYVDTVGIESDNGDRLRVRSLAGRPGADGPAALFGHDFSVPDLEIWTPWTTRGPIAGGVLTVRERPERTVLDPVPGLWDRLRRQRELERGCRRGIRAAEAATKMRITEGTGG